MSTNDPGMAPPPPPSAPRPTDAATPPPYGSVPPAAPDATQAPAYGSPASPTYGTPPSPGLPPTAPGAPGYPYPAPPPSSGGKGLAIGALVVAVVALLLSWVPIINNVAAVLAVVGLVLGVVALVLAVRKGRPGKGLAIAAVVVSVVSLVVVVTTQIAYGKVIDEFVEELDGVATGSLEGTETEAPAEEAAPEEADAPAVADLAVVEAVFGQNSYDPTTWWYVVIVENPNPQHAFPLAGFDVEAVGADGTILDTSSDYVHVLPGRVALSGSFLSVGSGVVDHLDVRGPDVSDAVHEEQLGGFTVAEVAATGDTWSTKVGGILSGTFADEQEMVRVDVVARDAEGRIIGAEFSFVDRLPVGGQARFEVTFLDELPADATFEVYAAP